MFSQSETPRLEKLYCSKCGVYIAETTDRYLSVYCSSCWNNMKTIYTNHIQELTKELSEKDNDISELEDELAESDELALGGSG